MKLRKIIILTCIGMSLFMLFPITSANAQDCYYCNPLLFPFAVVGAAVGVVRSHRKRSFLSLLWTLLRWFASTAGLLQPASTGLLRLASSGLLRLAGAGLLQPTGISAQGRGFAAIITAMGNGSLDTGAIAGLKKTETV